MKDEKTIDEAVLKFKPIHFVGIILFTISTTFTLSGLAFNQGNLFKALDGEVYARKTNDKEIQEITDYKLEIQSLQFDNKLLSLQVAECQN